MADEKRAASPREPQRGAPQSGTRSTQVARSLRETVSAFATETLADDLVYAALVEAGLSSLPETAEGLRELAEGALHAVVTDRLGHDSAEAVLHGLEPMLGVLARMDRRRQSGRVARLTPRSLPPVRPAQSARVAVVTHDPRLAVRLRLALGAVDELARYETLGALIERGRVHASVILDCRGALGREHLPTAVVDARAVLAGRDVLLLFAGTAERSAVRNACPTAGAIVCASRDVADAELAQLLATFLGTH